MSADQWRAALADVVLRHPNGRSAPVVRVIDGDPPSLYVGLDCTWCTGDGHEMTDFAISTVRLTYFPGVQLARMWLAAAWVGFLQHEALELATVDGVAVLNPHDEPYVSNPVNRGLRNGFPVELTYESTVAALELIMARSEAERMMRDLWEVRGWPYESQFACNCK